MATLGNTNVGATEDGGGNGKIIGSKFTAAEAGTITKLSVYVKTYFGGGNNLAGAVYSDSAGTPNALLASDSGHTAVSASATWYDITLSYAFNNGDVLWLFQWGDSANSDLAYDAGGTNQASLNTGLTFASWPATWPGGGGTSQFDRAYSIYATYTPAAGGSVRRKFFTLLGVGS